MQQQQFAASLEFDTPMYSKVGSGERRAKREQGIALAKLLQIDEIGLVKFWITNEFIVTIETETEFTHQTFKIALRKVNQK